MQITPIKQYYLLNQYHTNKKQDKSQPTTNNFDLPKLCTNQIYFTGYIIKNQTSRILNNLNDIEVIFKQCFSPAKVKYIESFDNKLIFLFNKLCNQECSKVILKKGEKLTYTLTGLEDDGSNFVIKLSKVEHNNQKFVRLSYSKDATKPYVLLISPNRIYNEKNPEKILFREDLLKLPSISMLDNGGKKIIDNLLKFKDFINLQITSKPEKYFLATLKNSIDLINEMSAKLDTLDSQKKHAIKRSYSGYLPFPRKKTFQLIDTYLTTNNTTSYALIPHRENESYYYRLLQFNNIGEIEDAYLISPKNGVVKNYCQFKKFNWASTAHTTTCPVFLKDSELLRSNSFKILTKYYNLLDDFSKYIDKTKNLSFKTLQEDFNINDSIRYNTIKTAFLNKIPEILAPSDKKYELVLDNKTKYILSKENENNLDIIKLVQERGDKIIITKIDTNTAKILLTNPDGKILFDKKQNPLYFSSKSNAFEFKTKLMKEFIQNAYSPKDANLSNSLQTQMLNLKETYFSSDEIWKKMSKTKKTDFIKVFPSIVEARGNTGEIRFQIPNKDYQLGLKPQKLNSSEFMRFSIYDKDGKLQKAFLINNFTNFVDNYCTKGYTKDSISRIPPNIIHKTEDKIVSENIPELTQEYITELVNFNKEASAFSIDKRIK